MSSYITKSWTLTLFILVLVSFSLAFWAQARTTGSDQASFENKEFTLQYPQSWRISENSDSKLVLMDNPSSMKEVEKGGACSISRVDGTFDSAGLESILQKHYDSVKSILFDFKILKDTDILIQNRKAKSRLVLYRPGPQVDFGKYRWVAISGKTNSYLIKCGTREKYFSMNLKSFDMIIGSFSIKN